MTTVPDIPTETFPSSLPRRESAVGLSSARTGVVVHLSADSSIIEVPVSPGTAREMWSWLTRYLLRTDERGPLVEEMGKILNAEPRTPSDGSLEGVPASVPSVGELRDEFSRLPLIRDTSYNFRTQLSEQIVGYLRDRVAEVKRCEKDVPVTQLVDYAQAWARQNKGGMAGPLVVELAYVFLKVPQEVLKPYLPQPVDPDAELVERLAQKQAEAMAYVWGELTPAAKERLRDRARQWLKLVREVEQELKGEDQ